MKPTRELIKTSAFVGVAALLVVASYYATAAPTYQVTNEVVGAYFADFDSSKITSLKIVSYNEQTKTVTPFEVQKQNGVWTLPSHEYYPADASTRLGEALGQIQGLQRGPLVSESPNDADRYGVVSPENIKPDTPPGAVGLFVEVKQGNDVKAAYVIGGTDKENSSLRFIRRADEDRVYRAKVDVMKFATKFEEWIELDLLKMGSTSLKQVDFDNLQVQEDRMAVNVIEQFGVGFDRSKPADQRWSLLELKPAPAGSKKGTPPTLEPVSPPAELNTTVLDEMQRAFNDLKIVNVHRKPEKLSQSLQGQEVAMSEFEQQQLFQDMQAKGFFLGRGQIYGLEGQVGVNLEDGIQYMLKFGRIAGQEAGEPAADPEADPADKAKKFRRYLFITCQFNPDMIAKPVYEEVAKAPDAPAAPAEAPAPATDAPADKAAPAGDAPAGDAPAGDAPVGDAAAPAEAATPDACQETPAAETPAAETPAAETPAAETPAAPAAETPAPATPPAPPALPPAPPAAQGEAPAAPNPAALEAEKARIEAANAAKKAAYEKQIAEGEKKAKELNSRFANWYYVISSDVYDKIHLSRSQIVKPGGTPEDFRDLKAPIGEEIPGAK